MAVKFENMTRELFTPKERAIIRRTAAKIAKRHAALREEHGPVLLRNVGKTRAQAKGRAAS